MNQETRHDPTDQPARILVVLNAAPALEETLVDWLLARQETLGFTTVAASGHSAAHHDYTAAEQVKGRKRQVQFQVQLPGAQLNPFLQDAHARFPGADIYYWAVPVLSAGHLQDI